MGVIAGSVILTVLLVGGLFFLYLLPTVVALVRKKQNTAAIALVNLLLGWSFIGWVVALVWAVTVDPPAPAAERPALVAALLCGACGKYSPPNSRYCAHCGRQLML